MKQGDLLTLNIIDVNSDGDGVARTSDGAVIFVSGAITGETVSARVIFAGKKATFAKTMSVTEPSPFRIKPTCPHSGSCGGCDLCHVSFDFEGKVKREQVVTAFKKIAGVDLGDLVLPTAQGENVFGYRNKLQLPVAAVKGKPALGFYKKRTHDIIPLDVCPSNGDWSEKLIAAVKNWIGEFNVPCYDEEKNTGVVRHIVARKVGATVSVTLVINSDFLPKQKALVAALKNAFEKFTLGYSVNKTKGNVIMGDNYHPVFGDEKIQEKYLGLELVLSPLSFLQVNDEIAKAIYEKVASVIDPDSIVFDLYSGVGIMTSFIAKRARAVYGVEIVPDAVLNANENFFKNDIKNATAICGDVKDVLPMVLKSRLSGDKTVTLPQDDDPLRPVSVVVDPPRSGLDPEVIDTVLSVDPEKIIYVSCSPTSLARDVKLFLASNKYRLTYVQPFNMFPRSKHVETVASLERLK